MVYKYSINLFVCLFVSFLIKYQFSYILKFIIIFTPVSYLLNQVTGKYSPIIAIVTIWSIYRMSHFSKEFPAVPISARPIRYLADNPINSHIDSVPTVEGATANPDSSHSDHTVPYLSRKLPSNVPPTKFKFQPISFPDTKTCEFPEYYTELMF